MFNPHGRPRVGHCQWSGLPSNEGKHVRAGPGRQRTGRDCFPAWCVAAPVGLVLRLLVDMQAQVPALSTSSPVMGPDFPFCPNPLHLGVFMASPEWLPRPFSPSSHVLRDRTLG